MAERISRDAVKLKYASIADARQTPGLRLILGAAAVPGPWREACKGIFYVKKVPYVPVTSVGKDNTDRELMDWTAQTSAPVAILNDERPRSTWIEQLYLAERLASNPPLIPASVDERMQMFGYANEICGEGGFGWSKRLTMIHATITNEKTPDATRAFWLQFGTKYGYGADAAQAAPARMVEILRLLDARLSSQRAKDSRFFIGNQLSALDIYWATFSALVRPLEPELCPMATAFREFYTERNPAVTSAISPLLLEHRDFIYREYLELPIVF
jgi:glutathione S-transferase